MALQKFGKYKKYKVDDPSPIELAERQSKLINAQAKKRNPYNDPIAEYEAKKRPIPQYTNQTGEVNEQYRTGRGANALTGLALGNQAGQGRDNIFGISSSIAGLVAGLFSKNLAGKQKYKQDVVETETENQALYNQTNASLRLQALKQQSELELQEQDRKNKALELSIAKEEARRKRDEEAFSIKKDKNAREQRDEYQKRINTTTGEDRAFWQNKMAESIGYQSKEEDAYVDWGTEKVGDLLYRKNKAGEYQVAEDDKGNDISTLSTPQQIDILVKASKLQPTDRMKAEEAWDKANEVLKARGVDKQFTNPKTKASQYNALVMKMAGEILDADAKQVKNPSTYFRVDGVPYKLDLPILGKSPVSETGVGESPFMPKMDSQETKIVDATQPTVTPPNQFDYQSWSKTVKNPKAEIDSLTKHLTKLQPEVKKIAEKYGYTVNPDGTKELKGTLTQAEQWLVEQYTDSYKKYETLVPPPPLKQTKEEREKIEKEALENDYQPIPPKNKRHLMPEGMIHTVVVNGRLVKVKRVGKKLVEVVDK